jgi:hypothetical protein
MKTKDDGLRWRPVWRFGAISRTTVCPSRLDTDTMSLKRQDSLLPPTLSAALEAAPIDPASESAQLLPAVLISPPAVGSRDQTLRAATAALLNTA